MGRQADESIIDIPAMTNAINDDCLVCIVYHVEDAIVTGAHSIALLELALELLGARGPGIVGQLCDLLVDANNNVPWQV